MIVKVHEIICRNETYSNCLEEIGCDELKIVCISILNGNEYNQQQEQVIFWKSSHSIE